MAAYIERGLDDVIVLGTNALEVFHLRLHEYAEKQQQRSKGREEKVIFS